MCVCVCVCVFPVFLCLLLFVNLSALTGEIKISINVAAVFLGVAGFGRTIDRSDEDRARALNAIG